MLVSHMRQNKFVTQMFFCLTDSSIVFPLKSILNEELIIQTKEKHLQKKGKML